VIPTLLTTAPLAWTPFLDPLPLSGVWMWLAIPLAAAIAVVYKALKLPDLRDVPAEAARLTFVILIALLAAAVGLWALTEIV